MRLGTKVTTFLVLSCLLVVALSFAPFYSLFKQVIIAINPMMVKKVFNSSSTLLAIKTTLIVSLSTVFFSTIIAIPLSWLFSRSDLKAKGRWKTLFSLPYAIPPYIGAIAWIMLANPTNGILNNVTGLSLNIYSLGGLIWVMSSFFYTFILLNVTNLLSQMDPSLEEAARLSGANPFRVFREITLPLIRPGLISGMVLVFLAASASFGVPALVGGPGRIFLLTTKIYTYQKMGSFMGINYASILSVILFLVAIISLGVNSYLLRKNSFGVVSGKSARANLIPLHRYMLPVQIILGLLLFILLILPIIGIFISALAKVQGIVSLSNLTLVNFSKIFFDVAEFPVALRNSLMVSSFVATLSVVIGFFVVYAQKKTNLKFLRVTDFFISLPYATPGTVLSLALILAFSGRLFGVISFYNTLILIGLAYFIKYLNFSVRALNSSMVQIDQSLLEAAQVSGANFFKRLLTIWFPLLRPALISSWFLVFMPCVSELTMTILLTGPGLETLGTLLFQLQNYGDASGGGAAVLSLLIIMMVLMINYFVKFISKGKYGL